MKKAKSSKATAPVAVAVAVAASASVPVASKPRESGGVAINCEFTELRAVAALVPNPRNPTTHPESQIALLAKIIKHQGWRSPIVVSKRSGFVVKGHGRLAAATFLKLEQVPVDAQDYATEADEWADMMADNAIAGKAETDEGMLRGLLEELKLAGNVELDLTGFTMEEITNLQKVVAAPESFPSFDENIPTDHQCPKCGYKFSGGK